MLMGAMLPARRESGHPSSEWVTGRNWCPDSRGSRTFAAISERTSESKGHHQLYNSNAAFKPEVRNCARRNMPRDDANFGFAALVRWHSFGPTCIPAYARGTAGGTSVSHDVARRVASADDVEIRLHPIPSPDAKPYIIVVGPDGRLGLCERGTAQIGRPA